MSGKVEGPLRRVRELPNVRKPKEVKLVVASDIHLSHKPPIARQEDNWYVAMGNALAQVRSVCETCDAPFVIAGDLFDNPRPPHELVDFAVRNLPGRTYAIPGQHDLPSHNYELRHKSAYGVLEAAGVIENIVPDVPYNVNGIYVFGFPWGSEIKKPDSGVSGVKMCLAHRYVWAGNCKYPNAPVEASVGKLSVLRHFNCAVFGDNHKGFLFKNKGVHVLNCGGFMRRKSDEKSYQPVMGLVYSDGSIRRHPLDTTQDTFTRNPKLDEPDGEFNIDEFVEQINKLGEQAVDFHEQIEQYLLDNKVDNYVEKLLREMIVPC